MCTTPQPPIFTRAELLERGRSRRAIGAAVGTGSLVRLRPGVYAESDACESAAAAARHGGALACISAARHLGLWVLGEESPASAVHVWLRGHGHAHPHEPRFDAAGCGCVEHWDDAPITDSFGLPSVPRILRQVLGCLGIEAFFVTLESALRKGLLTKAGRAWLLHSSNDAARDAILFARADADSGLESLLRWRLRPFGLRIRAQVTIACVGCVDFLIGDLLIIETDGRENHDGESERHKDLVRDANAATWGYITLRFDYAMIVHDWETVETAILAQVKAGRHLR